MPFLWVDHRPRIAFYVREGLVPKAPSDDQLGRAFDRIRMGVGIAGQIRFYARNPRLIFPTASKRAATRRSITDGFVPPQSFTANDDVPGPPRPLLDRCLERTFLFAPARLAVQSAFNPWALKSASGLNTPGRFLIAHILHTNHPPPALWDMQIVQADPGGLEQLLREVDRAARSPKLRARIDRALGCREGYYDYLLEWIPRVARFEFPPIPSNLQPIAENLVDYLNFAAEL
jgi:hypothetical protein